MSYIDELIEKAFSDGYEYAQKIFFLDEQGGSYTLADVKRHAEVDPSAHYNQSNWTKKNLSMADRVKAEKAGWSSHAGNLVEDTGQHTIKNNAQLGKAKAAVEAKGGRFSKLRMKNLKIGGKMPRIRI